MEFSESSFTLPQADGFPDTDVDWYDFGGGWVVAPNVEPKKSDGPNMAALCCVRNGMIYYKVVTGTFTGEDLPDIRKKIEPDFLASLPPRKESDGVQ